MSIVSDQRQRHMGLLEMKRRAAIELSVEMHGLRDQINRGMDAHHAIAELEMDELNVLMQRLQEKTAAYRQLIDEMTALCDDLGLSMPNTDVRWKR